MTSDFTSSYKCCNTKMYVNQIEFINFSFSFILKRQMVTFVTQPN